VNAIEVVYGLDLNAAWLKVYSDQHHDLSGHDLVRVIWALANLNIGPPQIGKEFFWKWQQVSETLDISSATESRSLCVRVDSASIHPSADTIDIERPRAFACSFVTEKNCKVSTNEKQANRI
jgi:hypothetical protein